MRLVFLFIFILLIVVTFCSINNNYTAQSVELTVRTSETDKQIRADYIDSSGRITFAGDKGYASVVKKIEDGHVVLEQYLDEKGRAVTLPAGYSQIVHEYEDSLNTVILYYDVNSFPVVVKDGYSSVHRTYNSFSLAETDTYWIGDTQVERKQGYWQYHRLYTDGKISEIRYLDQSGELVNSASGYALIRRSYVGSATVDLYYDASGLPASSTLGQYGKKTETVDGMQITTYLGIDGMAENTVRGYAIVKRDRAKTLYYDKDGSPVTIGRNQYGIQKVGGQNIYLDEDGEQMLRLDNVLNTHPLLVLVFGVLMAIFGMALRGKGRAAFLILYVCFIVLMTIAYRETGNPRGRFELFHSYKQFLSSAMTRQNILNNIWLFVPLGAAIYAPGQRWGWLWAIGISVGIELIQFIFGIGLCELDDIISNSLGAIIGFGISCIWKSRMRANPIMLCLGC